VKDDKATTEEGSTPGTLHVREDREEVVARAVRLAGQLQTEWEMACTLSAPRLRPVPDALQPFDYYNSVLGRPRLVLAPMVTDYSIYLFYVKSIQSALDIGESSCFVGRLTSCSPMGVRWT
jgi:hypothetical protein